MRRFPLGRTVATVGATETMRRAGINPSALLRRHASCDWGTVPPEDAKANDKALHLGERLLSSYGEGDDRLWIITEADRSSTTILRPDEY
jgi:hypothetical protein